MPQTVAVLRFSAAGDVVLTLPAVATLARAWPQAKIVYVTHERFVPLVREQPGVHELLPLRWGEGVWSLRQRLVALGCDAVLDLHNKVRSWTLRCLLGHRRQGVLRRRSLQQILGVRFGGARYHAGTLVAARYHAAVEDLVGHSLMPQPLCYQVRQEDQEAADALLRSHGLDGAPCIGLSPGAAWATKRWPSHCFADLARMLRAQGLTVLLTGSAQEAELCAHIAAVSGARSLAGQLPFNLLGGIIARCQAFVANDSGPMHVARGLGVPTLAIFGSTDPGQFDFSGHAMLSAQLSCAPCSFHGARACPRGHLKCLTSLQPHQAWVALQPLLKAGLAPQVMG